MTELVIVFFRTGEKVTRESAVTCHGSWKLLNRIKLGKDEIQGKGGT